MKQKRKVSRLQVTYIPDMELKKMAPIGATNDKNDMSAYTCTQLVTSRFTDKLCQKFQFVLLYSVPILPRCIAHL